MFRSQRPAFFSKSSCSIKSCFGCLILVLATLAGSVSATEPDNTSAAKPAVQRCGLYLHACWNYKYPFGLRSWQLADYHNMFLLLRELGFNTVMFWPALEEVPAPLSEADREAVRRLSPDHRGRSELRARSLANHVRGHVGPRDRRQALAGAMSIL